MEAVLARLRGLLRRPEDAPPGPERRWRPKAFLRGFFFDDYRVVALFFAVFLAVLAAFSLCVFYHMRNSDQALLYYTSKKASMLRDIFSTPQYLLYLLAIPPLGALIYYVLTNKLEFSLGELLCAGFFTFNMVVSLSMEHSELSCIGLPLTRGNAQIVMNILACGGFFVLTFTGVHLLYTLLDRKCERLSQDTAVMGRERRYFLLAFFTLALCWAPVIYACLPGGIHTDTITALAGYFGYTKMDVSFPILTTILYGEAMKLGKLLSGDALGAFFCVLAQDLFNALVMAKVAVEVRRYTKSFWWYLAVLLFYALCPVWQKASVLILKDVFHTGCFLLFCMQFFGCLVEKRSGWKDVIWMGICMILVSFTRRATYWLSVICVVVLIVSRWKDYRVRYTLCLVLVMALFSFCNKVLYPALDFKPEREVENYSLPFQQMAMYVKTHEKEITKEEKAIINDTLDFDRLLTDYTPMISDPVKHTFHAKGEDHSEFFKLFFYYMRKHPLTFVKSFFMGSFEHSNPWYDGEKSNNIYIATNEKFFSAAFRDKKASWNMNLWLKKSMEIPVLRVMNGNGLYSWILLAMVGYASYKRSLWGFLGAFPTLVLWIGLFMSHVNGLIRYGYPLIASAPLVCAFAVYGVAQTVMRQRAAPAPAPPEPREETHELRWLSTFRDPGGESGESDEDEL